MNDLISRQAAIDAIEAAKEIYVDRKTILAKTQDIINNLPSAQPEQHWIPCSERLPETEISVLIWLPSHWNINGGTIEIGFLDEDNEWNWLAESMSDYYEIVEGVSAWMPLPDPWERSRR